MHRYSDFRAAGFRAVDALRAAKISREFYNLACDEKVGIVAEQEAENYFDVYGEPEGYQGASGHTITAEQEKENIQQAIEINGCWHVRTWSRCNHCANRDTADSIGMCICADPTSPLENPYVIDLMASAIAQYREQAV